MIRVDAVSGAVLGEYRTAPQGLAGNPSRTSVDSQGNVWIGNADEESPLPGTSAPRGSVVKIGICLGGTRVNADGTPNPNGLYLKGPFALNTCVDRNHDGLIRTSRGLGDVLAWPNVTDGLGGNDGIVQDAVDEAILVYQRTTGQQVRHVSVDANDDVWVAGYPIFPTFFDKLSGTDGSFLTTIPAPGCGGHGGVVDGQGVLWSTSEADDTVMRYEINSGLSQCIGVQGNHGMGIDPAGNIWVCEFRQNSVTKIAPNGTIYPGFPKTSGGATGDRAICVTPVDSNVWVDNSAGHDVSRLDNNGNVLKVIDLGPDGVSPRGLSVDSNGQIWTTCSVSSTAKRIDPHGGGDGLGAVDLTVPLGQGAHPDDYSDMTGVTPLINTQPSGSWQVVYDSGVAGTEYGTISWHADLPAGTLFTVEFRASDDSAALSSLPYTTAQNGTAFSGVFGRYVQVRARFRRAQLSTATPVLYDLTISPLGGGGPTGECPGAIRNPASLLVFPEFDNRVADLTLLTVTNTQDYGDDVNVEFVYVGRIAPNGDTLPCLEFNRTRTLTPRDTISLITSVDNPNQAQGYVYVFAKSKTTGQAIVHNALVGNALVIDGISALSYSYNPYAFLGVGDEGTATDHDGDGVRDLNNIEYSCAPDEILVPRFFGQDNQFVSPLILVNLTGGSQFTAIVDILGYNDNEEVFSAQESFTCWEKKRLTQISGSFDQAFLVQTNNAPAEILGAPGRETGWFRINGSVAYSAAASIDDPAILALLVESSGIGHVAADLPFENGTQSNGDLVLEGIFPDSTP
jgi:streptogramin lyase